MQIILASAKIMNDRVKSVPDISLSTPRFQNEAEGFARDMAQYSVETIAEMLGCSLNGHLLRTQISHISIWFVVNRTPYSHSPTDSAYALLNFALGCLHRGQRQSSGKSSKVTPSCSAGS